MTKIYLVYMRGITENNDYQSNVWAVFTNKRKAQIYCKYREEIATEIWMKKIKMKKVSWIVEEERIWTEDFSIQLNEIQMEKQSF